jgi:hypothetical protein
MPSKPTLSFEALDPGDLRAFVIADTSSWKHLESEPKYIDITIPGKKTAVTHNLATNRIQKFNSSTLEYASCANCENELQVLPDGLYKVKIYVCEGETFSYERYVLRSANLKIRWATVFSGIDVSCNPDSPCIDQLMKLHILLKGAEADLIIGNTNKASIKFKKASEMMDDIEACDCPGDCNEE